MNRRLLSSLVALGLLGAPVASAQKPRKTYCSVCNDTEAITAERARTGSCANLAGPYEEKIKMTERDFKDIDITPHRALLAQCKADVLREQDLRRAESYPADLTRLFPRFTSDDCGSLPPDKCQFEVEFGQLKAEQSVALIKELSASPLPAVAARFQKAQAALEALPVTLAPHLEHLAEEARTAIEDAKRFRESSLVAAEEAVHRGLKITGYALRFVPQHAASLKLKGELEPMAAKLLA